MEHFDPTAAATWTARGRSVADAEALASIWRALPDLPASASADARMERIRARVNAMRPISDAAQERQERERRVRNFAFVEGKAASGAADARDLATLRARDQHGFDWDEAVRYAEAFYAARAGWSYREPYSALRERESERRAYDTGFTDGGGDRDDLFDAARRAFVAAAPRNQVELAASTQASTLLPSSWPKPTDAPRPTRWHRRLAILTERDLRGAEQGGTGFGAAMLQPAMQGMTVVVLRDGGITPLSGALSSPVPAHPHRPLEEQLQRILAGLEVDDIFTTAAGTDLTCLDSAARALPISRNRERAQNSLLQQRVHVRTWLERGVAEGENIGAGHIRWGKVAKGLRASLGEFTAVDRGSSRRGCHEIHVLLADGTIADQFLDAAGQPLNPKIRFPNRSKLRYEMTRALRMFGGGTRLTLAEAEPSESYRSGAFRGSL